jgi:anti-sigma regulatory factor (Ser/Thr protein kinase)
MAMTSRQVHITTKSDAAESRRVAVDRAEQHGFDEVTVGRVALVATELATNIAQHADSGELLIRETAGTNPAIELLAIDKGPGIANLDRAMEDGYSTAGTLGHGLGSIVRQADHFEVFSRQPGGTVAMARIWRTPQPNRDEFEFLVAGVSVAYPGEPVCGDEWAVTWRHRQGELLVADGLGHGIAASEAALQAVRVFVSSKASSAAEYVEELHHGLRATRGAAVAVAAIDLRVGVVKFAGLGNIGASIVTPERKRTNLVSQNGTAGHAARRVNEFAYPFMPGSILVMFSDGLGSGWDPAAYPGLWSYDPAIIAGVLYRDFFRRRDDVTVVVARERSPI